MRLDAAADTFIASARLRGCGGNHSCRALFAVGATAVEAERLGILPIRLLRQLGYEDAEETVVAAHYRSAVLVALTATL